MIVVTFTVVGKSHFYNVQEDFPQKSKAMS